MLQCFPFLSSLLSDYPPCSLLGKKIPGQLENMSFLIVCWPVVQKCEGFIWMIFIDSELNEYENTMLAEEICCGEPNKTFPLFSLVSPSLCLSASCLLCNVSINPPFLSLSVFCCPFFLLRLKLNSTVGRTVCTNPTFQVVIYQTWNKMLHKYTAWANRTWLCKAIVKVFNKTYWPDMFG